MTIKKIAISLSLSFVYMLLLSSVASAAPAVTLDGERLNFDVPPVVENDTTLVPLRAIFESLGATVQWDSQTQTITAIKDNTTIRITLGQGTAYKNDTPVALTVPGKSINNRTMVPLRFISEALGAKVDWVSENQTITITSKEATTGTFQWDNGVYSGEISNTIPNGHGYYYGKDGTYYDGSYVEGKENGQGTMTLSSGGKFEGLFKDGLPEEGTYTDTNGNSYKAKWENNQWVIEDSSSNTSQQIESENKNQNIIDTLTDQYDASVIKINDAYQSNVEILNKNKELELDNLRTQMGARGTSSSGISNELLQQLNEKYDLKLQELKNIRDNALDNLKATYEKLISQYK